MTVYNRAYCVLGGKCRFVVWILSAVGGVSPFLLVAGGVWWGLAMLVFAIWG